MGVLVQSIGQCCVGVLSHFTGFLVGANHFIALAMIQQLLILLTATFTTCGFVDSIPDLSQTIRCRYSTYSSTLIALYSHKNKLFPLPRIRFVWYTRVSDWRATKLRGQKSNVCIQQCRQYCFTTGFLLECYMLHESGTIFTFV